MPLPCPASSGFSSSISPRRASSCRRWSTSFLTARSATAVRASVTRPRSQLPARSARAMRRAQRRRRARKPAMSRVRSPTPIAPHLPQKILKGRIRAVIQHLPHRLRLGQHAGGEERAAPEDRIQKVRVARPGRGCLRCRRYLPAGGPFGAAGTLDEGRERRRRRLAQTPPARPTALGLLLVGARGCGQSILDHGSICWPARMRAADCERPAPWSRQRALKGRDDPCVALFEP